MVTLFCENTKGNYSAVFGALSAYRTVSKLPRVKTETLDDLVAVGHSLESYLPVLLVPDCASATLRTSHFLNNPFALSHLPLLLKENIF